MKVAKGMIQNETLSRILGRMIGRCTLVLSALVPLLTWPLSSAHAMVVEYTVAPLGVNAWRYDYTLTNIDLTTPFDELTVYFDFAKYELLSDPTAPTGWDPLVVRPDLGIPSDGFYDVLRLAGPLSDTNPVSGFSVSFLYLGIGTPGAQPFTLLHSSDFSVVQLGKTQVPGAVGVVPEPSTAMLLLLAGPLLMAIERRRRRPS